MLKRNFSILLIGLILNSYNLLGQADSNLRPPSPNAAALGNISGVNVGLNTGTPQFSIPIYTINTIDLQMPISLLYSSNGVRVDELPSEVGNGWVLVAGGVITRNINDEPDDSENRRNISSYLPYLSALKDQLYNIINTEGSDQQPDIFSFNITNYAGKFYLDSNLNAILINPLPIKIEVFQGIEVDNNNLGFKITTQEGLIYWFGDQDSFDRSYTKIMNGTAGIPHNESLVKSTWYLTKITLLNSENISFEYDTVHLFSQIGISQSAIVRKECSTECKSSAISLPVKV